MADGPRTSIPAHLVNAFVKGIQSFSTVGTFLFQTPRTQEGKQGTKRKSAYFCGLKHDWRELLCEAQERIREVESEGRIVVFSDGSSIIHEDMGPVAGLVHISGPPLISVILSQLGRTRLTIGLGGGRF